MQLNAYNSGTSSPQSAGTHSTHRKHHHHSSTHSSTSHHSHHSASQGHSSHHSSHGEDSVELSDAARNGGSTDPSELTGSGGAAVNLAKHFLGHSAQSVKGLLANYHAAGGKTNDCADFVSAVEMNTGRLHSHATTVDGLRQNLVQEGWHKVSKGETNPGDIAIYGSAHTEMVAAHGANRLIGANGKGQENVSYTGSWGRPTYYARTET